MAGDPFTIRIFVADGDPDGIRLIDRMNWAGTALVFPRGKWSEARKRAEFQRTGVYILSGYRDPGDELPTLYIGQSDRVADRIDSHADTKEFWNQAFAFVSTKEALNSAHVRWLEHALIRQAIKAKRSKLDNGTEPGEPPLSEAERADSRAFLREILQILPIVGLRAFEEPRPIPVQGDPPSRPSERVSTETSDAVTVIVPAQEGGFQDTFLGEKCWYAIRIAGGKLAQIRYIAAYRTAPISAVTHYAPVASIEPFGEEGKYKLNFAAPPTAIGPIPFGDAPSGSMQGPRYTTLGRLHTATKVSELFSP